MKTFFIICVIATGIVTLTSCSSDNDRQTTTTTSYESATVDTKDMHHRSQ